MAIEWAGLVFSLDFVVRTDDQVGATSQNSEAAPVGCLSNKTALAMIFKLAQAAEKSWRRLKGYGPLPKVTLGVKFNDGIEIAKSQSQIAAA